MLKSFGSTGQNLNCSSSISYTTAAGNLEDFGANCGSCGDCPYEVKML